MSFPELGAGLRSGNTGEESTQAGASSLARTRHKSAAINAGTPTLQTGRQQTGLLHAAQTAALGRTEGCQHI